MKLRLGTRASELARTQSGHVAQALTALGHEVELVTVRTHGDVTQAPLSQLGGTGVFAAELRHQIREGMVDLAVHSLKDLPTAPEEGLVVAAIPPRWDDRDVLVTNVGKTLDDLAQGAKVGTGSPRRAAQLLARRPDLSVSDIRGNVDTRIRFVSDGVLDAVILAAAGLARLGRLGPDAVFLDFLPAPAQGALAVECRDDATILIDILAKIDDPRSRFAATAERTVLAELQAGCAAPIGTKSTFDKDEYRLDAVLSDDSPATATKSVTNWRTSDAAEIGRFVARQLR